LTATAIDFADALNKATVEQFKEALVAGTLPPKQRNRVEIALKIRSEPAKADDAAKGAAGAEGARPRTRPAARNAPRANRAAPRPRPRRNPRPTAR